MAGEFAAQAQHELTDIEVVTVGLVGKGANDKKFLLLKSFEEDSNSGGNSMAEELVKTGEAVEEVPTEQAKVVEELPVKPTEVALQAKADLEKATLEAKVEALTKKYANIEVDLEKAQKRAEEAERVAMEERDRRLTIEYLEKAEAYSAALPGKAEEIAKVLRKMRETDSEMADFVEGIMKTANEYAEKAAYFTEIGTSEVQKSDNPFMAQVEVKRAALKGANPELTDAQALAKAYEMVGSENKMLAKQYIGQRQRERK